MTHGGMFSYRVQWLIKQLTENINVWELWYFKAVTSYRGERFQVPTRQTGEYKVDFTRHPKFPLGKLVSGRFPHCIGLIYNKYRSTSPTLVLAPETPPFFLIENMILSTVVVFAFSVNISYSRWYSEISKREFCVLYFSYQ